VTLVAIAGTGLIGSSIGFGLSRAGWTVYGWDPDEEAAAGALAVGAVDEIVGSFDNLVAIDPDLLVLAGPPAATVASLQGLSTETLTIDVAGVKRPIVAAAGVNRFVGTHPMAGREVSGPEAATPGLFRGATWVITTDGASEDDLAAIEALVRSLGATPARMTAAEHDAAVARISHLPQLVAAAMLVNAAGTEGAMDLAAGSFRDITRVAASDPALWVDVLAMNRDEVIDAADNLMEVLGSVGDTLGRDHSALSATLDDARTLRARADDEAIAVRVALADRPGELAKMGRALERSAVDVRDLQLRHAPHGGGGILTLTVRPSDEEHLRSALIAEGLDLVG
jgi:prephenate dehydrogenase